VPKHLLEIPCRWIGGDCSSEQQAREEFEQRHVAGVEPEGDPHHWARPMS
jgi:hypothetical protein